MNNLIDFYDYSFPFSLLYQSVNDDFHHDFDHCEFTLFGFQVYDIREFELLCELHGCLDADL